MTVKANCHIHRRGRRIERFVCQREPALFCSCYSTTRPANLGTARQCRFDLTGRGRRAHRGASIRRDQGDPSDGLRVNGIRYRLPQRSRRAAHPGAESIHEPTVVQTSWTVERPTDRAADTSPRARAEAVNRHRNAKSASRPACSSSWLNAPCATAPQRISLMSRSVRRGRTMTWL